MKRAVFSAILLPALLAGCDEASRTIQPEDTCGRIERPDHGAVEYADDFLTATISCNDGFRTSDDGQFHCANPGSPTAAWGDAFDASPESVRCVRVVFDDPNNELEWAAQIDTRSFTQTQAAASCDLLALEGDGWRLPTMREYFALVLGNPSLDLNVFAATGVGEQAFFDYDVNTEQRKFWTSTLTTLADNYYQPKFFLHSALSYWGPKSETLRTMCVRGYSSAAPVTTDLGNGTVRDAVSGREWQRVSDGVTRTHAAATNLCANLPLAGGEWRLPTAAEFASMFTWGGNEGFHKTSQFDFNGATSFWTADSAMTALVTDQIAAAAAGTNYAVLCVR